MTESNEPLIRINGVSKHFGDFVAVDNVSLEIGHSELFSILGGSGCGKSTLLRMMAGFEAPTSGTIEIDGVDVTQQPPYERPVNMIVCASLCSFEVWVIERTRAQRSLS